MAILTVGPTSTYPSIASALVAANAGDELALEAGYSNEDAVVTVNNLFVSGNTSSKQINLQLGAGIGSVTLLGDAPIHVSDNSGDNTITANAGANLVEVSGGVDVAHGGLGIDRLVVDYSSTTASVTAGAVNVTDGGAHTVTFDGFENFTIRTGIAADTLTVADGNNILDTGDGNDTTTAGNGQNRIYVGAGDDTVTVGTGGNTILGGAGDDTITAGSGADTISGGLGDDTITAGDGDNVVSGDPGNDTITTGSGNDIIKSGAGNDSVVAGAGNDGIFGDGGVDTVDGGAGLDRLTLDYSGSSSNVTGGVSGSLAAGYSGSFADTAGTSSTGFAFVEEFTIRTGIGNDTVETGGGSDTLAGNNGDDTLTAGAGADTVRGGRGADLLTGGLGADFLTGGLGSDTYVYTGVSESTGADHDVIHGFNPGFDLFALDVAITGIDAQVMSGQLDSASFNADLEAAVTSSALDAHHALIFTPDSGSSAGESYIIVDANGAAGFQAGQDYVFQIEFGHHLETLNVGNFI